ncbi:MAG TPA: Fic family protein [Candidatus Thiothrix moscowensis]|uniref:Fic family protein n=1 Tax=unclassified Thiothrix TaxID=2636184 RepID=UPI0025E8F9A2|nr:MULTISPECIES: Fic family protein [unclassified Thiothrix]HRJ52685.1 Fic family protein [Candidatus Thiothrix moscowensis]HRJ92831.1 Fic family protein [Candidatus Thiothrix moscowensis]
MHDTHWQMPPNPATALMLAKRQLSEFVCDAVNLEGINMTLPEVQTLLDGITVGGHKLSDQQVTVNQGNAWRLLFGWLECGEFTVSAEIACKLHAAAGKEEALEWGRFRSGGVLIAGTDYLPPPVAELPARFEAMIADLAHIDDIYDQAIHIFLTMARCQFFYDVNKRMGRFMMNGHLLQHGYPAINLPAKRQLEFNMLMLAFYASGDETAMNAFMRSCMDERVLRIMREIP